MIEPEFPEETIDDREARRGRDYEARAAKFKFRPQVIDSSPVDLAAPQVIPSVNAALDIKVVQQDRAAISRGYPFVTFDEMEADTPAKQWLIKGILARGETSAWIAPPGAMKSALLAEAAICVAAGIDWHGHRNKGAAGVLYFAIERSDLVKRRLRAHRQILGLKGTPICVSSSTIDLTHPDAFKKVIDTIRDAKTVLGADIGLVIIDTFAKLIAAAAGDENSAKDQGAVFANVQRVKNMTGVHADVG